MWPDRVSNPGPLTYESGALPTALCGPAPDRYLYSIPASTVFVFVSRVSCLGITGVFRGIILTDRDTRGHRSVPSSIALTSKKI